MRIALACTVALLAVVAGCSGSGESIVQTPVDQRGVDEAGGGDPDVGEELEVEPDLQAADEGSETVLFDAVDVPDAGGPACAPGEGCFLDPCSENGDCQSGWCVSHMGDSVCTQACQEECPPGWSCKQVGGTDPDLVFVCVSHHAHLCKPCSDNSDCEGVGTAASCLDYGEEGSFCGGTCSDDTDCPWGFLCSDVVTVDGIGTLQCVAEAGVCPCTSTSVARGLFTPCEVTNEFGTCLGKRFCTEEGLSDCDAPEPAAESCNGLDDDCDGSVDEPQEVGGNLVNLCDDGNDCTEDTCAGEAGCEVAPLDGVECKDGNPCTVADHCEQGVCVGSPVDCNDDNPCTDDSCDESGGCVFTPNGADCDDGDPCTLGDHCVAGECSGEAVDCTCQEDADCAALEDDDLCNGILVCANEAVPYQCVVDPETVVICPAPEGVNAPCLEASCNAETGACSLVPAHDGAPCEEGDSCTLGDTCQAGVCTPGPEVNCGDGNPCTDDVCDPDSGCVHTPNDGPCSDGDVCTLGDHCANGQCSGGEEMLLCDDGNVCTDDSCDSAVGCLYAANSGACDDGNACTEGDHCVNKSCQFESLADCDDDNPCTTDGCDPVAGCTHQLNEAPCNDGDKCTTDDFCQLGECKGAGTLDCDDSNPCTVDSCAPQVGCKHVPGQGECDDGNPCTVGDHCTNGQCTAASMLACDDDNPCTTDSCDPGLGCVNAFNNAACNDGDVCTLDDYCQEGACTGGQNLNCDDGNPCTDDACDPAQGCIHTANQGPCTDNNECTVGDHCLDGECVTDGLLVCDDDNVCTNDNCDPVVGCVYSANTQPCDDEDECTLDDSCADGVCTPGTPLQCPDDGNACTEEYCDSQIGCTENVLPDCCGNGILEAGEECDDGNQNNDDGCQNDCTSGVGCSIFAEYHYEVVSGIWACVNNQIITTYEENNSMCATGWTPATYNLVQGLPFPSLQQHQAMGTWHNQVMSNNGGYIRTGQKRRGGCTPEAHGDIYIKTDGSHYESGGGWHDLFYGGSSCNPDTYAANNMGHPLAGVICVKGEYEYPQP